jgi:TPR repeat protein
LRGLIETDAKQITSALATYRRLPGNPIALNNIARLLISLDKTPPGLTEATKVMLEAASLGYAVAQRNVGRAFMQGVGVPRSLERASSFWRAAAAQGHPDSMYLCGMEGRDSECLRGAARKGDPQALAMYASTLVRGGGARGERPIDYHRAGAELGFPESMNNYAVLLSDADAANRLWRRAAEMGLGHGGYNLAVSYVLGRGVERDEREAARWMKMAADQQHPGGMFDYAMMLRNGVGVEKDEAAAEELCRRAGERKEKVVAAQERARKQTASLPN